MTRRGFEEQCTEIQKMLLGLSDDAAGNIACVTVLSQMLLAEVIIDLTESLRRKNGEDDVKLLDDFAQSKFQFEAHGAGSIDPTVLREDLNATLDERNPINQRLWNSHS